MRHFRANGLYLFFATAIFLLCHYLCDSASRVQTPQHLHPEEETSSGAEKSMTAWSAARAYPGDSVPEDAFYKAYEETEAMRISRSSADNSVQPWEAMGPLNIGGRTLALAFDPTDPDILYAGSASGGLWRSTTAGVGVNAWEYLDTGFPVLGVSSIAIDPMNRDVIYIGTGETYRYQESNGGATVRTMRGSYGIGILKSVDRGLTWSKSLDWSYQQSRGIWSVQIDPSDTDIIFAATTEGIYRSTNAGADWELSLDVIMATDIRFHPTDNEILFAACGNFASTGFGIYRTQDGGDSWAQLTSGLPSYWSGKTQLAVCNTSPPHIYASIGNEADTKGLYLSTDDGSSWELLSSTDYARYQGWFSHWVLPHPTNPSEIFVGGIDIWHSSDGGDHFTEQSQWYSWLYGTPPQGGPEGVNQYYVHADQHFALHHPTDPGVIYFATDGGVFRTTNNGNSFEGLNGGYATTQFYSGFSTSASTSDKAMGGLQDNMTVIYEGSTSWRREIGGDGFWTAIHPTDPTTLYGEYTYLSLRRSRSGGDYWTQISPPQQSGDETAFSAPYLLSQSDPNILYAGRSRVYKTFNEGNDWSTTNGGAPLDGSNPAVAMTISQLSPDTVYVATAPLYSRARVFRTTNGGDDWTDITGSLPDRYPADLAIDPNNAANLFISFSGFGTSHLFKSTDGGDNWLDINGSLPDLPIGAVTVDPAFPEVVYAGNDIGVYISGDGGQSWSVFDSGMPIAMVSDLKISLPNRKLRVSTHGSAVFERDLYDPSTAGVADGVLDPPLSAPISILISPNPITAESRITFTLRESTALKLQLFDISGRMVGAIAEGRYSVGDHSIELGAVSLSQGIYFLRATMPSSTAETRLLVTK